MSYSPYPLPPFVSPPIPYNHYALHQNQSFYQPAPYFPQSAPYYHSAPYYPPASYYQQHIYPSSQDRNDIQTQQVHRPADKNRADKNRDHRSRSRSRNRNRSRSRSRNRDRNRFRSKSRSRSKGRRRSRSRNKTERRSRSRSREKDKGSIRKRSIETEKKRDIRSSESSLYKRRSRSASKSEHGKSNPYSNTSEREKVNQLREKPNYQNQTITSHQQYYQTNGYQISKLPETQQPYQQVQQPSRFDPSWLSWSTLSSRGYLPPPSVSSTSSRYSFVHLVMKGDAYIPGALVSAYSIRLTKTIASLVCMVTSDVSNNARSLLSLLFDEVIEVPYLICPCRPMRTVKQRSIYEKWIESSFTKWNCLSLTKFDKVLFIDADVIVLANIDHLFQLQTPAGTFSSPWADTYTSNTQFPSINERKNRGKGINNPYQSLNHADLVPYQAIETGLHGNSFVVIG